MNPRVKISAILISLGLIMALLPLTSNMSFVSTPDKVLHETLDKNCFLTADQVAKLIISEDKTIQLIDLRSPGEYHLFNIQGSVNIPYNEFLSSDPGKFLGNHLTRFIFYSNDDLNANYALTIARGLNYHNTFVLKGGLNEWFHTIMNSGFSGVRITARENALYETRKKARNMFIELNSLPDSLKEKFVASRRLAAKKLDGGCE
jgi:rhodanese-related sulfurtransferase